MVGLTTATEAGLWPEVLTRAGGESEVVEAMRPSKRPLEASSIFVSRFNWEKSMGSAIKHGLLKIGLKSAYKLLRGKQQRLHNSFLM